ncbi:MAG: hypothetical protein ACLQHK_06620 [Gallionellaceae bacterium]
MKYRAIDYKPITDQQIGAIVGSCDGVDSDGLRDALDGATEQFIHNHYDQKRFPRADLEKRLGNIVSTAERLQELLRSGSQTKKQFNNIGTTARRLHHLLTFKMSDSFELESILNFSKTERQNERRDSFSGNLASLITKIELLISAVGGDTNNNGNSSAEIPGLYDQMELLRRVAFEAAKVQKNQKAKSKSVNTGDQAFNDLFLDLSKAYMSHFKDYPVFMVGEGDPRGRFATFISTTLETIRINLSDAVKASDPTIAFSLTKSPKAIRAQWLRTKPALLH